jgi:hypothetical protein
LRRYEDAAHKKLGLDWDPIDALKINAASARFPRGITKAQTEETDAMSVKPGSRWKRAASTAEVVAIWPVKTAATLQCGGHPMTALVVDSAGLVLDLAHSGGVKAGKRNFDQEAEIEVLASKVGAGSLLVRGHTLTRKKAKALPAAD